MARRAARWAHRLRVAEAMALLCLAWPLVKLVPFRRVAPLLGTPRPPAGTAGTETPLDGAVATPLAARRAAQVRAAQVRSALASAGRRLPWESTCLMRTLAGRLMLGRRGVSSVARLGVTGRPDLAKAHAWLIAAGLDVSGGAEARDYTPISEFVA